MTVSTESHPSAFPATCTACRVDFLSSDVQPDHDHLSGTPLASTAALVLFESIERDRSLCLR
jgi:hypothetical protein